MTSGLRQRWEERAARTSNACEGVLFQGLPPELNGYLHERHLHALRERFLPMLPQGAQLLDLGCGYGRIGGAVRAYRPDIELTGADFALPYCAAFKENIGAPAVGAELMRLPFLPESFDAVVAVTVLMYAPPAQRRQALAGMAGLLKPGGVILLVDPGEEFQRAVAALKPAAARNTTGGRGFAAGEMAVLAQQCGLAPVACGSMPWGSWTLPLTYGLIVCGLPRKGLLRWLGRRDDANDDMARWSIHRWVVLRRGEGAGHG